MSKVNFRVMGSPMGKQRPRVTKWGAYTPQKTVNYETLVQQIYMTEVCTKLEGELEMKIRAYFDIPKSASNKKRLLMASNMIRPTKKPDSDNILKLIADACNKIAYHDDSQIVSATVEKFYSEVPRVEVEIREVGAGV